MATGKTRWTYSFSNLGPKKQIGGTTFYKVNLGSETKWLSMEGVKMLEKARQAGTQFKTVRKATKFYTLTGTRKRLKELRMNIDANLNELIMSGLEGFEITGKKKGIITLLDNAGLTGLMEEFKGLLDIMTEDQLREFYADNKLLLQKFFENSDVLRAYGSGKDNDADIRAATKEVRNNGEKLRDKMLKILTRDMTLAEMKKVKDPKIATLLIGFAKKVR